MNVGKSREREGFTIIEVVLVLAIAGLIFLMIFVALPALNRTQRDSRRRDDISVLLRKLKDFQTNNRGALPSGGSTVYSYSESSSASNWGGFYRDYLGKDFVDPSGGEYKLEVATCGEQNTGKVCRNTLAVNTQFPNDNKIHIVQQATCDGDNAVATKNIRKVAVQYKLEGGGIYCANT